MTMVGLIRHGSTEWNLQGRTQGALDTDLTEEGREQARQLGRRLKAEPWDFLISSDLRRARESAELISALSGIPLLRTDSRLREKSFGQLEGTTLQDRIERWGPQWSDLDHGGETDEQVRDRWMAFSEDLFAEFPDSRILLVSHGGFIGRALETMNLERADEPLTNASLTLVKKGGQLWECSLYNCTVHLK
ncbi:histidine phosphatase family protein [Paenibacillus sp. FJAT-26967]|uniref:histidine phosphatase family protein n=1 Tax=Paenibacillus sp. FJAT-26967 TaxID=1729690 RepID=UPI0008381BA4|nr:histidine phosphatase family protein [Paenibacillus sp. FJAT-26967]